ncbi:MAG TPA: aspartyl/asparaginyl beta-hydroxylase domain-containing protein [Caulobacteraceae bacterium]|jgi:aspartyl/asparaginyl beta-hydroxylase (cupin superfamily)|nr:aspartyl/asparaginyl beta-hydroxylase domain-containing protein [Caulobacteraceae bacterium]
MSDAARLDELAQAASEALRRKDPAAARELYGRLAAARPSDPDAWHGMALACRGLADEAGEKAAFDRALALDHSHLGALMMKGDFFARTGDGRAAHAFYKAVVARAAGQGGLSPQLRGEVQRAERECQRYAKSYEDHLVDAVKEAGFDRASSSPRFARSLEMLLGKQQIFLQTPKSFYFPELPQRQFYERAEFPWLSDLEARTAIIRQELAAVVGEERHWDPYVQSTSSRPHREYGRLLDNLDWSAFYLVNSGHEIAEAARRCPQTLAALEGVPLSDAPGGMPSVLFSLLRPHVRIPPHTGHTNARLICHLPLIVPGKGALRVGNETRAWTEGEALIFDDSIEHEAWNDSDEVRVVLLFDIWRPELTMEERGLVRAVLGAVNSYSGQPAAWD